MVMNYTYLNTGLAFVYNGSRYISQKGLYDLLSRKKAIENLQWVINKTGDTLLLVKAIWYLAMADIKNNDLPGAISLLYKLESRIQSWKYLENEDKY